MAYYRSCLAQAFLALERHPRLLLLHLDLNYPVYRWNQKRVRAILEGTDRGWVEEGMLISSWQTAGPALDVSILDGSGDWSSWLTWCRKFMLRGKVPLWRALYKKTKGLAYIVKNDKVQS